MNLSHERGGRGGGGGRWGGRTLGKKGNNTRAGREGNRGGGVLLFSKFITKRIY